jgi:hypothetical protein
MRFCIRRGATREFCLDRVANSQPQRLLIWRRFVLAALCAAEADDRRQILAYAVAIQTLFQVRIESGLIPLGNRSVNQIVDEFLTSLAGHCLSPSFCLIKYTQIGSKLSLTEPNSGCPSIKGRLRLKPSHFDKLIRWLIASRLFLGFLLPQKPAQFHPGFM